MSHPTLLVIGKVWPEPQSSAAGTRMLQLLNFFLQKNYKVHFASAANAGVYSANLNAMGITCDSIELNSSSFDNYISQLQPQVVLFDRFTSEEQFGWRVQQHSPNSLLLLDTEDLHSLRHDREQALKRKSNGISYSEVTIRELSSIYRCDASIIISKVELELLQERYNIPEHLLIYLPLLHDTSKPLPSVPFEQREHFVTIGNFLHAPNKDSVLYLRDHIWPLIHQRLPKAKMLVYGAYADEPVLQWSQPNLNFFVMGRAESAEAVMSSAKVCLAPLRFGAGQKGKLLLAMQCKTPSVTTSIGAEGMLAEDQWPGAIASDEESFVEKALQLYNSQNDWQKASADCVTAIQHFDKEEQLRNFSAAFDQLQKNYLQWRENNLVGQLLRYHANHSTRYMSLWIEAKNKNNS